MQCSADCLIRFEAVLEEALRDEGPGKLLRSPRKCLDPEEQEEQEELDELELDSSGDEFEGVARIEFVPVISYISPSPGRLVSPLKVTLHHLAAPAPASCPASFPTSYPSSCRC